jgi:hypothetical protein
MSVQRKALITLEIPARIIGKKFLRQHRLAARFSAVDAAVDEAAYGSGVRW